MADEIWTYTNASDSTKTLTFATVGGLLDASGETVDLNEITGRTKDGTPVTHKLGDAIYGRQYGFIVPETKAAAETDYDDFKEFIGSTYIDGSVNAFTWTDYNGTERTVYLMGIGSVANEWIARSGGGAMQKRITVSLQEA